MVGQFNTYRNLAPLILDVLFKELTPRQKLSGNIECSLLTQIGPRVLTLKTALVYSSVG